MVPASTLIYGSSFCMVTEKPRFLRRRPRDAVVMPLPMEETTPPVTRMYFVFLEVMLYYYTGSAKPAQETHPGLIKLYQATPLETGLVGVSPSRWHRLTGFGYADQPLS